MIASMLNFDRSAIKSLELSDDYAVHKLVYSLFPGNKRTFLYCDQGGDFRGRRILLLSQNQPLLPSVGELESKRVSSELLTYSRYIFQIQLNPVVRKSGDKKFIPVVGQDKLREWFLRRQADWGFAADPDRIEISDTGIIVIEKGTQTITYNKALFRGILEVHDKSILAQSFEQGIGRGKAFGFGLLQIKPVFN